MKFYISTKGIKRVTITNESDSASAAMKGKSASRRIWWRPVFPALIVLGIVLPFVFVRIAFLVLECSSSIDCTGLRFFGRSDTLLLGDELRRALVVANEDYTKEEDNTINGRLETFNDLVKEMTSNRQDIKAFAFKTKAMFLKMEHKVQSARYRESLFWHFASHGIPKSLHCLCLKLAEEYAVNALARSRLPPPEHVSRLADPSFHHFVLFTDNVLAASVVVSSAIKKSVNPEKLVFHIVTDKKTYTPMHAWFAINSVESSVVEVKGLHQFDWSHEVNVGVKEMLEIHQLIWKNYFNNFKREDFNHEGRLIKQLDALSPSCISLMSHLRIYIPELFPNLNKIVFLDDDIVVQSDLSSLWEIDLKGKVVGAVFDSGCGDGCCPGRKYKDYFNFTNPLISSNFDRGRCGWLYGMNIFDLQAWRRNSITKTYHQWLKLNLNSGFGLWKPGVLPPALIAFEGHVHPIDPAFHVAGLGHRSAPEISRDKLETASVIHFSGPAKPWLEIGFPEVRSLWSEHVNMSNNFIRKCIVMG